ncbi:hypothetical protein BJX63DRAFT_399247 [Aspergillus granulosus]|uniref:Uncharacterized protein n=1 Tax=Aspergillus granulosus TaxID=176169 RepID=A0ABR4H7J8_9EURO
MSTFASLEYTIFRILFAAIKKRINILLHWKPLFYLACHLIFNVSQTNILTYLTEHHHGLLWATPRLTSTA